MNRDLNGSFCWQTNSVAASNTGEPLHESFIKSTSKFGINSFMMQLQLL